MPRPMPREPPVTIAAFPDRLPIAITISHALMTTAAIIGAGDLGGAVAQALAARDRVARLVLIDPAGTVAAGKALDLQQSGAVHGFHTRLAATEDRKSGGEG